MERLTRSFLTTSVDINKGWRSKIYDEKVDNIRKDMKTVTFGENARGGRFSKIKKWFNLDGSFKEQPSSGSPKKTKSKSKDKFESRMMSEIYKNMSASHELSSMYN